LKEDFKDITILGLISFFKRFCYCFKY